MAPQPNFRLSDEGSAAVIAAQANGTSVVLLKMYLTNEPFSEPDPPQVPLTNVPTAIPSGTGGNYTGTFYWDQTTLTCISMVVTFDVNGTEKVFAWGDLTSTITFDSTHTTQMVAFSYNFTTGNGFNVEFDKAATYASLIGRAANDLDEVGSLNKPVFLHEGKFVECTTEVLGPWFNYGFKHSSATNNQETFESESIRPITEFKNRKKPEYKVVEASSSNAVWAPWPYDTPALLDYNDGNPTLYTFDLDAYSGVYVSYQDSNTSNNKRIFFSPNDFHGDVIQNSEQPSFYFRKYIDKYIFVTDTDVSNWTAVEIFYAENNCCPIVKINNDYLFTQTKSEFTASYYEATCAFMPGTQYEVPVSIKIDNQGGSLVVACADQTRFWNGFQSIDIWYPEASTELATSNSGNEASDYNKKASLSTGPVKVGSFVVNCSAGEQIELDFYPNSYYNPNDSQYCLQMITDDATVNYYSTPISKYNMRMYLFWVIPGYCYQCEGKLGSSARFELILYTDALQVSFYSDCDVYDLRFDVYSLEHSTVKSEFVDCKTLVSDVIKMPISLNPSVYIESTQFDDMTSDDPDAHSCYISDDTVNLDSVMPMSNIRVGFYDSTTGMSLEKLLSPQDWIAKVHALSKAGIESFAENCYVCLLGEPEDYYYASMNSNMNTCMVLESIGGKNKLVFYGKDHADSPSNYFSNCSLEEINIPPKAVEVPGVFCQDPTNMSGEKKAALLNSNSLSLFADYGSSNQYCALRKSAVLSTERLCFSNYTWDEDSYAYGVEFFDANYYYCSKCTFDILPYSDLTLSITTSNPAQDFTVTIAPSDWMWNYDHTVQFKKSISDLEFSWNSRDRHLRIEGSSAQYTTLSSIQYKKNYGSVFPAIRAGNTMINQKQMVIGQNAGVNYTALSGNEIKLTDSYDNNLNKATAESIQITQNYPRSESITIEQNQFQSIPNNQYISEPTINIPPFSKFFVSYDGTDINVTPQCWRQEIPSSDTYLCVILENSVERWTYDTYTGKLTITVIDAGAFTLPLNVYISVDYQTPSIFPGLSFDRDGIIINGNGIGIRSTNTSYANATFLDGHDITIDGKTILYGTTNDTGANIYSNPSDYLVDTAGRPILLNAVQIKEMIDAAIQAANS